MSKLLISSVVSADQYQGFVPLFCYSILRAYPDVKVKIFVKGILDEKVRRFIPDNTDIHEEMFLEVPDRVSTCNSLRHLIPIKYFKGFDYFYNTDVDFILFSHKVSHLRYYSKIMQETGLPYAGARGPIKGPKRPEITKSWDGKFKRVAMGCLMTSRKFYEVTTKSRRKYRKMISEGKRNTCHYREYDEVLFQKICTESGLKTPIYKDRFVNGEKMNPTFRDVHLGDFKFRRWKKPSKMKRILTNENIKKFMELDTDPKWRQIVDEMGSYKLIASMVRRLRKYVNNRKHLL